MTAPRCPAHGFTLVELMIALLITLILIAGSGQIFIGANRSYRLQDSLARLQENGRYALATVLADIRRAGYLGGLHGIHMIEDNTNGGVRNAHRVATDDGRCTDINWVRMLSHPVFGTDDHRRGYDCLPREPIHSGDILVTRFAAPWVIGGVTTNMRHMARHPNHLYLRTSLAGGKLFEGKNETANLVNGSTRAAELVARGYFVRTLKHASACTSPGAGRMPALYRISQVNGALVTQEVARGVEQFQVQYGIDSNNNGAVDSYIDAMNTGDPRWQQVSAVRIWLLVRAECAETNYDNTHRYSMGNITVHPAGSDRDADGRIDGDIDGDGNDDYRRHLFSSTVALRNR
jgi:type IV pilus assembly protein PilW